MATGKLAPHAIPSGAPLGCISGLTYRATWGGHTALLCELFEMREMQFAHFAIRTYVSDRPACLLTGPKTKQHVEHRTCSAQCLSGGAY